MQLSMFLCVFGRCGRSAVYRTREMAARALVPFVPVTRVPSTVRALLQELPPESGPDVQHNYIHGTLLQVCAHAHVNGNQCTHVYTTYAITFGWWGGEAIITSPLKRPQEFI